MFCSNCGKEIREGSAFCGECGTPVAVVPTYEEPVVEETVEIVEESVVEEPVVEKVVEPVEEVAEEPEEILPVIEEVVVEEPVVEETPAQYSEPVQQEAPAQCSEPVQNTTAQATTPQPHQSPMLKLPTDRAMWKMFVFGFLTLGVYPTVVWFKMIEEINITASRYDGVRTTNLYVASMLSVITLGIYGLWYMHTLSRRIGTEVRRRGYDYKFGAGSFWGWNVFGALIIVGPFVYLHKLTKSMNLINTSYNYYG